MSAEITDAKRLVTLVIVVVNLAGNGLLRYPNSGVRIQTGYWLVSGIGMLTGVR